MAQTKHTPFPWRGPLLSSDKTTWYVSDRTHNWDVATCRVTNATSPEAAEANMRIIAAAPELLAFAQDFVDSSLSVRLPEGPVEGSYPLYCACYGRGLEKGMYRCDSDNCPLYMARAAIAKATGVEVATEG